MLLLVKKEFENLYPKDQSQNLKQNAYAKIERNRIIYKTRNLHCPTVQFLSIYCQPQTIDSYRIFHLTTKDGILFSSAYGTCFKINNILGHKTSFSKYKRIWSIQTIFSDHNIWNQKSIAEKHMENSQIFES